MLLVLNTSQMTQAFSSKWLYPITLLSVASGWRYEHKKSRLLGSKPEA